MILFGAGGIWVEVLEDAAMRLVPLDLPAARELIAEAKTSKILKALRGQPPLDINSLAQSLVLLSRPLMMHCPQIDEVDLNPV